MNTRDEEYLLALNQYRSITQAAEKLHVTQPALSIFLSKLETSLDMVLFERMGKKLIPTQAGKAYLKYARQIMAAKSDFELEAMELKKEKRGELHVGCLNKRSIYLMPELIRRFKETHPGIDVILYTYHPDDLLQMLKDGQLDLAYLNTCCTQPDLMTLPVRKDHLLLVLPQKHPATAFAVPTEGMAFPYLSLKYVASEIFYVLEKGFSLRYLVDEAMAYFDIRPSRLRTVRSIDLGCQMAAEGLGISFTTETYIKNIDYTVPRNYFLTGDLSSCTTWNVIWRSSSILSHSMKDFINLLKQMEEQP